MKTIKIAIANTLTDSGRELIRTLQPQQLDHELMLFGDSGQDKEQLEECDFEILKYDEDRVLQADIIFSALRGAAAENLARRAAQIRGRIFINIATDTNCDLGGFLYVPEVNRVACREYLQENIKQRGVIINLGFPAATALAAIVNPLQAKYPVARINISTLISVSEKDEAGMSELVDQIGLLLGGNELNAENSMFSSQIAFNIIPFVGECGADNHCYAEERLVREFGSLFPALSDYVYPTCVYVPVFSCYTSIIDIALGQSVDLAELQTLLNASPGLMVTDNQKDKFYPMNFHTGGLDAIYLGRFRSDKTRQTISFVAVLDNVTKGIATNAVSCAELIAEVL